VCAADVARQFLRAGLLDEIRLSVAPVLLGDGVRLFDGLDSRQFGLERTTASRTFGTAS
jgi:dihydrofolate reductase